jgi:hypothetical protein
MKLPLFYGVVHEAPALCCATRSRASNGSPQLRSFDELVALSETNQRIWIQPLPIFRSSGAIRR